MVVEDDHDIGLPEGALRSSYRLKKTKSYKQALITFRLHTKPFIFIVFFSMPGWVSSCRVWITFVDLSSLNPSPLPSLYLYFLSISSPPEGFSIRSISLPNMYVHFSPDGLVLIKSIRSRALSNRRPVNSDIASA